MDKNIVAIIIVAAMIFALTAVLLLDLNFKTFNFIEGIYLARFCFVL